MNSIPDLKPFRKRFAHEVKWTDLTGGAPEGEKPYRQVRRGAPCGQVRALRGVQATRLHAGSCVPGVGAVGTQPLCERALRAVRWDDAPRGGRWGEEPCRQARALCACCCAPGAQCAERAYCVPHLPRSVGQAAQRWQQVCAAGVRSRWAQHMCAARVRSRWACCTLPS